MFDRFPNFNRLEETQYVDRNPGCQVKPEGKDGQMINFTNFLAFQPQHHDGEDNAEHNPANRKNNGEGQRIRPEKNRFD